MYRGVVSAKEKHARKVLSYILKEVVGKAKKKNEKLVFCIPAQPIDQEDDEFDVGYHEDVVTKILLEQGYQARAINEAEALCYSELENDDYTGVALSCLVPGTKIYTRKGITNIEDVQKGDEVFTHKGRWRQVNNVVTKQFEGVSTSVKLQGYSNDFEDYKFVDNHELYVKRDNRWQWVGCEELAVGEIVGERIAKRNRFGKGQPGITLCERKTNSSDYTKTRVSCSPNVQRLVGYFLGDGSVNLSESCVQFDFGIAEKANIQDVQEILARNFNKACTVIPKGDGCLRIKCYSKGLANWFSGHLYNDNKEKYFPWDLSRLSKSECANLLAGLVRSDGHFENVGFRFSNTNTHLIWLARQLCARLGFAAATNYREPRPGGIVDDRQISGKKREWVVSVSGKMSSVSMVEYIKNVTCETSKTTERIFLDDGFICSRVQDIRHEEYCGAVYDLQVEEDHSFSGPFLTIHNCGAGMQNVCVMLNGEPVMKFSVAKSGDWIDRMASIATGESDSVVQAEKEHGKFTVGVANENPVLDAVQAYYVRLIDYVVQNLVLHFKESNSLPKFSKPLSFVVAGGTSKADGFVEILEQKLLEHGFPLEISEVRHASDPLHSVAKGCLIAAQVF